MSLTVGELIELLQEQDSDKEVRLAMQPSWPFEYSVKSWIQEGDEAVYLIEESQIQYLDSEVAESLGW